MGSAPTSVDEALKRMLANDPDERPETASAAIAALAAAYQQAGASMLSTFEPRNDTFPPPALIESDGATVDEARSDPQGTNDGVSQTLEEGSDNKPPYVAIAVVVAAIAGAGAVGMSLGGNEEAAPSPATTASAPEPEETAATAETAETTATVDPRGYGDRRTLFRPHGERDDATGPQASSRRPTSRPPQTQAGAEGSTDHPGARTLMTLTSIDRELSAAMDELSFATPVTHTYNPLAYAWEPHRVFLERFGGGTKEALFLGMNPGPWGMAQTGVPFGEVAAVRDWMGIDEPVEHPADEHPKRVVSGFDCARSEVSGRRLWGWARERFGTPEVFFERFFVINYCPLMFLEQSGRNRTPDKLPKAERETLLPPCDEALRRSVELLRPKHVIGVGSWAMKVAKRVLEGVDVQIGTVLHPSPASPKANRGWASQAEADLSAAGITL